MVYVIINVVLCIEVLLQAHLHAQCHQMKSCSVPDAFTCQLVFRELRESGHGAGFSRVLRHLAHISQNLNSQTALCSYVKSLICLEQLSSCFPRFPRSWCGWILLFLLDPSATFKLNTLLLISFCWAVLRTGGCSWWPLQVLPNQDLCSPTASKFILHLSGITLSLRVSVMASPCHRGSCVHPVLDRPRSGGWDKYHCQSECFITKDSKIWDANLKKTFLSR